MHIIAVCNLSSIKIQFLMILNKGLLTELDKNLKKKILRKTNNFFWVGPVLGG